MKTVNPAARVIEDQLKKAFSNVEVELRAQLKAASRRYVDDRFKEFMRRVSDPTFTGRIYDSYRNSRDSWHDWIETDQKAQTKCGMIAGSPADRWEDFRKCPSMAKKNYRQADEDAAEAYVNARDSFVEKNLYKVMNVLGSRSDVAVVLTDFAFRAGVFEGKVYVSMKNGDEFTAYVHLKRVDRYIPRWTPYHQYPLTFHKATVGKKTFMSPSEEELRNLFTGKTSEQHKAEKAAEAAAEGYCPMSGKSVPEKTERVGRYRGCPSCGTLIVPTGYGLFPKHKTKEAQKKAAAVKMVETGYCPMSRQKVPAEIVSAMGPVEPYKDPKAPCPSCSQQVRLDARREWIRDQFLTTDSYPTKMKVESATYYKHKVK